VEGKGVRVMPAVELTAVISAASGMADLTKNLGLFELLKNKLIKQPDQAAADLAAILDEFSKIYIAIDMELCTYFSVLLYDGMSADEERDARKILGELEGGTAKMRVAESRGHSTKIRNIYNKFLAPFFQKVFQGENVQMSWLFNDLEDADRVMIKFMDSMSEYLQQTAAETNRLLNLGDRVAAQRSIRDSAIEIRFVRKYMVETLVRLRDLQADFIALSGTTK
jgi:hypothetical protein